MDRKLQFSYSVRIQNFVCLSQSAIKLLCSHADTNSQKILETLFSVPERSKTLNIDWNLKVEFRKMNHKDVDWYFYHYHLTITFITKLSTDLIIDSCGRSLHFLKLNISLPMKTPRSLKYLGHYMPFWCHFKPQKNS